VVVHKTTYASTVRRVGGYLIDFFLQLGIALVVFIALSILDNSGYIMASIEDLLLWFYVAFVFASSWLYGTLQITSKRQATLGMRAVGIFRTDLHGGPLSFGRASAWWLYRLLSYPYLWSRLCRPAHHQETADAS
jgi:uncharacterized RDD family membrane protein YckC